MIKLFSESNLMYPLYINLLIMSILSIPNQMNKLHPMSLMIMLIFIMLMISLNMNFMNQSWMPHFLFLILIGGLMIIYMYISSLSNNEMFPPYNMFTTMNMWKIIPLQSMLYYMYLILNDQMNHQDLWNSHNYMMDQLNMNIIYMKLNNKSLYFIMIYLYYTMICVMNICHKNKMPLRQLST